jgi:hypothetical protein
VALAGGAAADVLAAALPQRLRRQVSCQKLGDVQHQRRAAAHADGAHKKIKSYCVELTVCLCRAGAAETAQQLHAPRCAMMLISRRQLGPVQQPLAVSASASSLSSLLSSKRCKAQ